MSTDAPLPPLPLRVSDGRRARDCVAIGLRASTRVHQLANALGAGAGAIEIDGRPVSPDRALAASGVRAGSEVRVVGPPALPASGRPAPRASGPAPAEAARVTFEWTAGPDAGRAVTIGPGLHVIGSAPGLTLGAADPAMAAHHARVVVGADGHVELRDHRVGRPVVVQRRDGGSPSIGCGDAVMVGASRLTVVPTPTGDDRGEGATTGRPTDDWRIDHHRPPRPATAPAVGPLIPPRPGESAPAAPGWSASTLVVPVLGGLAISLVLHQPIALVLALVGAGGGAALAAHHAIRHRRRLRRAARADEASAAEFRARLEHARESAAQRARAADRGLVGAVGDSFGTHRLWERRHEHTDIAVVTLGVGSRTWCAPIGDEDVPRRAPATHTTWALVESLATLDDVPITIDLAPGRRLGLTGDAGSAAAVARSLVVQLACQVGPADLRLVVVTGDDDRAWEWARWLPHTQDGGLSDVIQPEELESRLGAGWSDDPRRVVIVVDGGRMLATRTAPLRRLIERHPDRVSVIAISAGSQDPPALCDTVVTLAADGHAVVQLDDGSPGLRVHVAGATEPTAAAVARRLARFADPELDRGLGSLPASVSLSELEPATSWQEVAAGWCRAGVDPKPRAVIGRANDGAVEIDLARDGPHALIAGTTGSGKSELLRTLVAALALSSPPELLSFVLIDYKGGAAFDACADLPHVVGVVTDLDEHLGSRVLRSLDAELRRREGALRRSSSPDLATHRADASSDELARLVVVVDEFAALAAELPDFLHSLVAIAQRGRSLGVHLVLATQRPGVALSDDIVANTNLRIALRMQDTADSAAVVGDASATTLARQAPGRAVLRLGEDELVTFQTARATGPEVADAGEQEPIRLVDGAPGTAAVMAAMRPAQVEGAATVLSGLVRRCRRAAAERGHLAPHRPWLDPLPDVLPLPLLEAETEARPGPPSETSRPLALGLVDLPDEQRQAPLTWDPSTGHLLVAGPLGSGTSTALRTIAIAIAGARSPEAAHLYVLDGAGTAGLLGDLADLPHCGDVVSTVDAERRARLLRLLCDEVERRRVGTVATAPAIVVLIDGVTRLRTELLELDDGEQLGDLDHLLADGPAVGITAAMTTDHAAAVSGSLLARCADRWLLGSVDRVEAGALGVTMTLPRERPPGRGVSAALACELQLAVDRDWPATRDAISARWASECSTAPPPVPSLPPTVSLDDLPPAGNLTASDGGGALRLPIGTLRRALCPAMLELHEGEHVLIAGPPRSGRTTAAATIASQWRRAVGPTGATFALVTGRRGSGWPGAAAPLLTGPVEDIVERLRVLAHDDPALLVVDDADLVHDDLGMLASLLAQRRPHLHVVATGRADSLRADYGHWTTAVRRSRTGLLLGAVHELDADLLGVVVRRRRDAPAGPAGRGHLVANGTVEELQVAIEQLRSTGDPGRHPTGEPDQEEPALVGPPALLGSAGQRCFG